MTSVSLRALIGKLNHTTRTALEHAAQISLSRTHYAVEIEHLLLQLIGTAESDCALIFRHFDLNLPLLEEALSASLSTLKSGNERNPNLARTLTDVLQDAWLCGSLEYDAIQTRSGFVVIALFTNEAQMKKLVELAPDFQKIQTAALRRDFTAIVDGSVESREHSEAESPNTSPGYAFFSYSHKDSGTVIPFAYYLAQEEIPPFVDDQLEYGDSWEEVIVDRIKCSKLLMVLMSKNSRESSFVKREIEIALNESKRIIPILVDGEPFEELKHLQQIRLMDTIHPKTPFIERLRKLLVPRQIPSADLQRRRVEYFVLDLFEGIFGVREAGRVYIGFGTDMAFKVSLDESLSGLDELDWAEVFINIRERVPDLKIESRLGINYSERHPTIRAFIDHLYSALTWDDICRL